MLLFSVPSNGKKPDATDLASAYLFGSDDVPLRADITLEGGMITCSKRTAGPAGLALLWPVDGVGRILLETVRLQERETPYLLPIELARGNLMRLYHKREDWGLFNCPEVAEVNTEVAAACEALIEALKADTPEIAAHKAQQALTLSLRAGEALTHYHAGVLLGRRKETGGFPRRVFGCQVDPADPPDHSGRLLTEAFDFATVPVSWKRIEPSEQTYDWKQLDAWIEWLTMNRIPMKGSNLVCFQEPHVPDWLHIWQNDFDTIRQLLSEHIRRVVNRYGDYIQVWDVISGIHAPQEFGFNFEQLIELTRIAATVTRQMASKAGIIIDLIAPWGEYYARNQQTIPPMLYAEMAIQTGINFDAFGLQFRFGADRDGMYVRDMFQVSAMLDKFGAYGKPLHVTAVQVPSSRGEPSGDQPTASGGTWHEDWSEQVQTRWLGEFYEIALSKPFVNTITWRDLTDGSEHDLPHGGLVKADLTPKAAYDALAALRRETLPHVVSG